MISDNEFLCAVYDHFRVNGNWPRAGELQVQLRHAGHVQRIAAEAGRDNVIYENANDGECYLTLKGIAQCRGSGEDIKNFIATLRLFASHYVAYGHEELTSHTIQEKLGLPELEMRRLYEIVRRESGLWSGAGQSHDFSEFHFKLRDEVVFFETIDDLEEYWRVRDDIAAQKAAANRLTSDPFPTGDSTVAIAVEDKDPVSRISGRLVKLFDPKLDELLQRDLRELEKVLSVKAWKAVAILAGSCVEALLLDIWKRREGEAKKHFASKWPNAVNAFELATVAVKEGYLTQDHGDFAGVLRRWRNLVHPAAAIRQAQPRQEIAEALVAFLKLLIVDVAGDEESKVRE